MKRIALLAGIAVVALLNVRPCASSSNGQGKTKVTNEFYTDQGVVRDGKFFPTGKSEGVPIDGFPPPGAPEQGPRHMRNFIDCVRSRKREDLGAEILEGHRTVTLAHLGNISYRLGEDVPFNKQTKAFGDDKVFHESFEDVKRYLADRAQMDLSGSTCRLGRFVLQETPELLGLHVRGAFSRSC
jgi:hypothetical protein